MDEMNDYENILKQLPEPDVYTMPDGWMDRTMMELWPRMIIRDRFTWVAKIHVMLYRWAKVCKDYLSGANVDQPVIMLSSALRPSKNKYGVAVLALSETLGTFRPGEVPTDEGKDMILTQQGLIGMLKEIKNTRNLINVEESFDKFVNIWNYRGRARVHQAAFMEDLQNAAKEYVNTFNNVWLDFYDLESRISGDTGTTQLTLQDVQQETNAIFSGFQNLDRHLTKARETLAEKIDAAALGDLPPGVTPEKIREEMIARVRKLMVRFPSQSIRNLCQRVVNEYADQPGAFTSADALRKRISR